MPPRTPGTNLFHDPPAPTSTSPQSGWLNAHCDGGARGNPGPSGFGAVLADDSGAVVAELSEFLGIRTNNFAEYSGLLGCLAYALEQGTRKLRVVSDSELMVKQIQGKYQVKSPDLKPLYDEAKRRIAQLDAFEITHALRHKNKDADRLANEAMDRGAKRVSQSSPIRSAAPAPAQPTISRPAPRIVPPAATEDTMLRGFTRDGVIHVLGGTPLPDGLFVKIIPE